MPPEISGKFIVIDGPDYCGKGTQHRLLVNYLLDHPLDRDLKRLCVVPEKEPYGLSPYHAEIRRLLRSGAGPKDNVERLAELFVADRIYHTANSIIPDLQKGKVVVCDRYKYSTLAYQWAQGVSLDRLMKMHEGLPVPDLVIFLDVPPEERLRRKANDCNRPYDEVFEKDSEFQRQLDNNFERLRLVLHKEPIYVVNGSQPPEAVHFLVKQLVDSKFF